MRYKIKIYKQNKIILVHDFFDTLLLHNLNLEGNQIFVDPNNSQLNKKNIHIPENKDNSRISIQYKIECFFDSTENPRILNSDDKLDWKIQIFSTENIGFIQDTTKEDSEKAIIDSWETAQPGRAERAKLTRLKFVGERKNLFENFIYENKIHKNILNDSTNYLKSPEKDKIILNQINEYNNKKNIRKIYSQLIFRQK